jgi:hypothetical protein
MNVNSLYSRKENFLIDEIEIVNPVNLINIIEDPK